MAKHAELIATIRDLVEGRDDCWPDDRHVCAAHGWTGPGPCPVARGRRLVEEGGRD